MTATTSARVPVAGMPAPPPPPRTCTLCCAGYGCRTPAPRRRSWPPPGCNAGNRSMPGAGCVPRRGHRPGPDRRG